MTHEEEFYMEPLIDMNDPQQVIRKRIKDGELEQAYNYPGGAYYDSDEDTYYNLFGQRLRHIKEYQPDEDGCDE